MGPELAQPPHFADENLPAHREAVILQGHTANEPPVSSCDPVLQAPEPVLSPLQSMLPRQEQEFSHPGRSSPKKEKERFLKDSKAGSTSSFLQLQGAQWDLDPRASDTWTLHALSFPILGSDQATSLGEL